MSTFIFSSSMIIIFFTALDDHQYSMPTTMVNHSNHNNESLPFYLGLTLAGTASSFLTCLFSLFHLQVFLQAYQLPLGVYSIGSSIFAVINTANDVAGAWLVDSLAGHHRDRDHRGWPRHYYVGISGCLFALCFLTPFFRYELQASAPSAPVQYLYEGGHFVTSLSLYDTMFSFHCILLSSIVTDRSTMKDKDRILFNAFGKGLNLVAPMIVAKKGLAVFDVHDLQPFRTFLIQIAALVCAISLFSQYYLITPPAVRNTKNNKNKYSKVAFCACEYQKSKVDDEDIDDQEEEEEEDNDDNNYNEREKDTTDQQTQQSQALKPLQIKQVAKDFWSHSNFRYWILMEMLLEGQTTFQKTFMKTFVDQLLLVQNKNDDGSISKATCDWFLSSRATMIGLASLAMYVPIQKYGYAKVYSAVFLCNIILSLTMLLVVGTSLEADDEEEHHDKNVTLPIFMFLLIQPVLLGAVGGAGFGLAMADMVLEMKCQHAAQGRINEPSLAGMFMGVNALFCKPTESILPIVTATLLGSTTDFTSTTTIISNNSGTKSTTTQTVLYRLLVLPPLICSILQYYVWSKYNLHPQRTQMLRKQLEKTKMVSNNSNSSSNKV
jgi:ABC-type transport system involved in cytochrome c biogenesis permease component